MSWDPPIRAAILALAGEMIPGREGLPSAATDEGLGGWLDTVAGDRPELVADLTRVVGLVEASGGGALEAFVALDDPEARTFADAVLEGYFANPAVRAAVGYGGIRPVPARADEDELRALTAPVLAHGPRYRPPNAGEHRPGSPITAEMER
jgi:hypothetical protein